MKMPTQGHRGHLMAWMHGSSGHRRITIAATYIKCLKQKVTTFPAPLTCSHNTVLPQHSLLSHRCRNCQQHSKRPWPQWNTKNVCVCANLTSSRGGLPSDAVPTARRIHPPPTPATSYPLGLRMSVSPWGECKLTGVSG
jgi:hypothetical protein